MLVAQASVLHRRLPTLQVGKATQASEATLAKEDLRAGAIPQKLTAPAPDARVRSLAQAVLAVPVVPVVPLVLGVRQEPASVLRDLLPFPGFSLAISECVVRCRLGNDSSMGG